MILQPELRPTGKDPSSVLGEHLAVQTISSRFGKLARRIEARPAVCLTALTGLYLLTTLARAGKQLWFDEIYTFYLARMDSIASAWQAVQRGVDLQPPVMFVLAHWSQKLFGATEVATRLPSIVGCWFACGCLFVFIQRRTGSIFGMCGAMLILLTSVYRYALEARPYGTMLAGAALALVSWQSATGPKRRWWMLLGIAAGLWTALASHCYAVILAIPFGAGEVSRSIGRKKIDWPIWCAFGLSATALVFYAPLLRSHDQGVANNLAMFSPNIRSLWLIPSHVVGGAWRVVGVLMVLTIWCGGKLRERSPRALAIPFHEDVAVMLLAAIPIFLTALIAGVHSAIFYRYALAAALGIVVLITQAFYRAAHGDPRIGIMILALLTGVFVERFVSDAFARPDLQPAAKVMGPADSKPEVVVRGHPLLSMPPGPLPLVVSNPFSFVQVAHYAPAELAARTYYLTDSSSARRYTDTDFFEIAVPILLREFPLKAHAVPYSTFTSTSKRFFLYASVDGLDWLSAKLGSENASFRLLGRFGPFSLFDVCVQCELADR